MPGILDFLNPNTFGLGYADQDPSGGMLLDGPHVPAEYNPPANYHPPAPRWQPSVQPIEGPASFLSQIPQALLGRPSSGVVDFGKGALYGLATGDSGGMNQGLLGSLGRLGMMAMAVRSSGAGKGGKFGDPMAILRVKDYFDQQDALKRDALRDPQAMDMTPEQFQMAHGFVPPTRPIVTQPGTMIPAGASDILGGRAQVSQGVAALPAPMPQQLQYQQIKGTMAAANQASQDPTNLERRYILSQGEGPEEKTKFSENLFNDFVLRHPIEDRTQYIGYERQPDGTMMPTIKQRHNALLTQEDFDHTQQWLEDHDLADKVTSLPNIGGFTKGGDPLYDWKPMNLPQDRERDYADPGNYVFHAVLNATGDIQRATNAYENFVDKKGRKGKGSLPDWIESDTNGKATAEERLELESIYAQLKKGESSSDKVFRESMNQPDPKIALIKRQAEIAAGIKKRAMEGGGGRVVGGRGEDLSDIPLLPRKGRGKVAPGRGRKFEPDFGKEEFDRKAAEEAGIKPDEKGRMPSRVPSGPKEGLILKSIYHPDFPRVLEEELAKGNHLYEKGTRYYTFKEDPGEGFDLVPDGRVKELIRVLRQGQPEMEEGEAETEGEGQSPMDVRDYSQPAPRKDPFGPEHYDMAAAKEAGMTPDPETGHWGSRIPSGPKEGLLTKSPDHPHFWMGLADDKKMGYHLYEKGGRYYSFDKDPGKGFRKISDETRDILLESGKKRDPEGAAERGEEVGKVEEKVPEPRATPEGKSPQARSGRKEESPQGIPTPAPAQAPKVLKLKARKDVVPDTAREFDEKIEREGYSPGQIMEIAEHFRNSDLNPAEASKMLEDVVKSSRKMNRAQKEQALRSIPKIFLDTNSPYYSRFQGNPYFEEANR